jgi:hypothetical protein
VFTIARRIGRPSIRRVSAGCDGNGSGKYRACEGRGVCVMAWHRTFKNWRSLHGPGQSVSQSVCLFQGRSVSVSVSVSMAPSVNVLFGAKPAAAA